MEKLTVVTSKNGEVLFKTLEDVEVKVVDILTEVNTFDVDAFINKVRDEQRNQKHKNLGRFVTLKEELNKKGYILDDSNFFGEYSEDMNYALSVFMTILSVNKDNIKLCANVVGNQMVYVFDDEKFFNTLKASVEAGEVSQEIFNYIRKAFYYTVKMQIDNKQQDIFGCDNVDPWDDIKKIVPFTDEHMAIIDKLMKQNEFTQDFRNVDLKKDELPISWEADLKIWVNNNWIEVETYKMKGNMLWQCIYEPYVFEEGNFLDFLSKVETLFEDAKIG